MDPLGPQILTGLVLFGIVLWSLSPMNARHIIRLDYSAPLEEFRVKTPRKTAPRWCRKLKSFAVHRLPIVFLLILVVIGAWFFVSLGKNDWDLTKVFSNDNAQWSIKAAVAPLNMFGAGLVAFGGILQYRATNITNDQNSKNLSRRMAVKSLDRKTGPRLTDTGGAWVAWGGGFVALSAFLTLLVAPS